MGIAGQDRAVERKPTFIRTDRRQGLDGNRHRPFGLRRNALRRRADPVQASGSPSPVRFRGSLLVAAMS